MLKLIFSDFSRFKDHREGVNEGTVVVDDLDPDKGLEHVSKV